jgi:hypothetical protein
MHDQGIPLAGHEASQRDLRSPAGTDLGDAPSDDLGGHPVAALSSAVLRTARWWHGQSSADLAAQADLALRVVTAAEDGTRPAWALPYEEFTALTDAVSALTPRLGMLFETAAACDLLLSCVLDGDQLMATDVLSDTASREPARALLRLVALSTRQPAVRLLNGTDVTLLRERAMALAASGSPDAWVGAEIASLWTGETP